MEDSNIRENPEPDTTTIPTTTSSTTRIQEENVSSSLPSPKLSDGVPLQEDLESSNHLTPEETQCDKKGLRAVTIVCRKCHRHEVKYLAEDEDDPEFPDDIPPKNSKEGDRDSRKEKPWECKQDKNVESCLSRRRKYDASTREKSKRIPVTGPVTEYKDAYRDPDWPDLKSDSFRPQFQPPQRIRPRPPWNSSISIPPARYQETLNAIETKLKVLDEAEDPPPDVMAAMLNRQNLREKYRQKKNGGGDECGACYDDDDDASPKDSEINQSPWGWLAPQNQPRVFVQGSHLELLEDESLLSDV